MIIFIFKENFLGYFSFWMFCHNIWICCNILVIEKSTLGTLEKFKTKIHFVIYNIQVQDEMVYSILSGDVFLISCLILYFCSYNIGIGPVKHILLR